MRQLPNAELTLSQMRRRSRPAPWLIALAFVLTLCSSCGDSGPRDAAQRHVETLLELLVEPVNQDVESFYHARFFEQTPREQLLANLQSIEQHGGVVRSYELKTWTVHEPLANLDGDIVELEYDVTRDTALTRHMFRVLVQRDGRVGIVSHGISSR